MSRHHDVIGKLGRVSLDQATSAFECCDCGRLVDPGETVFVLTGLPKPEKPHRFPALCTLVCRDCVCIALCEWTDPQ